jgi:hypothetical protein
MQVSTSVAEMTSDAAAKLWDNTINRGIFELIHSANPNDQLGGLLAIGLSSPSPPIFYLRGRQTTSSIRAAKTSSGTAIYSGFTIM